MANATPRERTRLDRLLGAFAEVRSGEGLSATLLAANVFLILMAYYVLKPVREALILGEGSAELKSYLSAVQVVLLAFAVPAYGRLVAQLPRMRLINTVTAFFAVCLVIFFLLTAAGVRIGIPFFLWIGIFNLMIVAQFWSFANDIYDKEEGERLFAIVGFGASLGAVVGARAADRLIEPLGVNLLLLLGAVLLVSQALLSNHIARRESERVRTRPPSPAPVKKGAGSRAFTMVLENRYLLLIALMLMLLNLVNTTGEYILSSIVAQSADGAAAAAGLSREQVIGDFYSKYYTMVNVLGLLLQLFVVSRVVKYLGVGIAVMILPVLALGAYSVILFLPLLRAVLAAKVVENSTDYSLNNTVRNMLFLPCTYEQKFSGKQAIDSFFVRMGDVLSATLVFVGTQVLVLSPSGFAAVNAVLVLAWLLLAWRVGVHYQSLTRQSAPVVTT
jgi:AAA family ATP:ADP antiporter